VSDVSASGGGAEGEFSRYCRERDLKFQQWAWVKRVLIRKGVIGGRRRAGKAKPDVGRVGMMRASGEVLIRSGSHARGHRVGVTWCSNPLRAQNLSLALRKNVSFQPYWSCS
jgi:hypothetical protein